MAFDIDVRLQRGERTIGCSFATDSGIVALFGPSGVGKTSTLNMVAGLVRPDAGHVIVGGQRLFDATAKINLPPARRRCGYVFQQARLFPHMKVRRNLRYGRPRGDREGGVGPLSQDALVEILDIGVLLDRWPPSLSGGEAQRVAIGRALLSDPQCLLLDEPLASLDEARRLEILEMIGQLHRLTAIPILYVSHDRRELDHLGGDVVEMA